MDGHPAPDPAQDGASSCGGGEPDYGQPEILAEIMACLDDESYVPDAEDEDWEDPDSARPQQLAGVSFSELIAEAEAWAANAGAGEPAAEGPQIVDAGFLPRGDPFPWPGPVSGPAAGFRSGGLLDSAKPGAALAGFADDASGENRDFANVRDDELIGLLRAWQRIESFGTSGKLSAIAELIRRRAANGREPAGPGRMPLVWSEFCADELAAALATSGQAATKLLALAHDLATKLPGTARVLREGVLDYVKAKIISDATSVLDAASARAIEAIILPRAASLTPGKLRALTARAVISVDPHAAAERRERAQKDARVERWTEDAGTAALCGRDLPAADVLAADQRITAWARELKAAGLNATMDELRARAFLDFLLGADSRPGPYPGQEPCPGQEPDVEPRTATTHQPEFGPGRATPDAGEPVPVSPLAGGAGPTWPGTAARINLTIPMLTLLGLAERPGEMPGLGAVDPDLARELARASSGNPRTSWCVTVTDANGRAIGHGCARPVRGGQRGGSGTSLGPPGGRGGAGNRGSPAFTQEPDPRLADHAGDGGAVGRRAVSRAADRRTADRRSADGGSLDGGGPVDGGGSLNGGFGRWRLQGMGASDLTVTLGPLAVGECDHRNESRGYVPSARLRHLVETRNAECTWPPCRRAATGCDFEHAIPFEAGGKTCECNGGPRCRRHHRAKQAPGWQLEQPEPGHHTWTTPSGRRYVTGPTEYPI